MTGQNMHLASPERYTHMPRRLPCVRPAICIRLLCVLSVVVCAASGAGARDSDKPEKISHGELTRRVNAREHSIFFGGVMISAGDTLSGPIVVISGALDIQEGGVLVGDAWIVNGKLVMNGFSEVAGHVRLVNSEAYLSRGGRVVGGTSHYRCECRLNSDRFEEEGQLAFEKFEDPRAVKTKLTVEEGAPNRTDYNLVNFGIERRNPRHRNPYVRGHALVRVPLRKGSGGFLGFDVDLAVPLKGEELDLIVRGFKKSFTYDYEAFHGWDAMVNLELLGRDLADYFERRGAEVGLRYKPGKTFIIETAVSFQSEVSLETRSAPTLFQSDLKKRVNPQIDDGERMFVSGRCTFDTRDDQAWPTDAWLCSVWIEKGIADGPGDFSYTAFEIEGRRYNRFPLGLQFDVRARAFSAFDRIPRQVTRSIYGFNGIRGLAYDTGNLVRGDRTALVSGELSVPMPGIPIMRKIFTSWRFMLFADVGLVAQAENPKSPIEFLDTTFDAWEKFAGVGFIGESFIPFFGLYIAQDLERDVFKPWFMLRFNRTF